MCLAIVKPTGLKVPVASLEKAFKTNDDGAGFAASKDGELVVHKGFFKFNKFMKAYERYEDCACLIHFRIQTHGAIEMQNCHPFIFGKGKYAAIHNGTIPIKCNNPRRSDTWHFVDLVLDPLSECVDLSTPAMRFLIEETIGWSKLAVMNQLGEAIIYNEHKGHWDGGVWYSNYSYNTHTSYSSSAGSLSGGNQHFAGSACTGREYPGQVRAAVERFHREQRQLPMVSSPNTETSSTESAAPDVTESAYEPAPEPVTVGCAPTTEHVVRVLREYGEEDLQVEEDIKTAMQVFGVSRAQAIDQLRLVVLTDYSQHWD